MMGLDPGQYSACSMKFLPFKSKCRALNCAFALRVILALGVSMTLLNVPVEWLSLGFDWTWMLLLEDVRQGVFYSTLFSFWIIFCGEHLMVSTSAPRPYLYLRSHQSCGFFTKPSRTRVRGTGSRRTAGRSGSWCLARRFSSCLI